MLKSLERNEFFEVIPNNKIINDDDPLINVNSNVLSKIKDLRLKKYKSYKIKTKEEKISKISDISLKMPFKKIVKNKEF